MGKQDKIKGASVTPLGGPVSMMPGGYGPGLTEVQPSASAAWAEPQVQAVAGLPVTAVPDPTQQRLVDLSIERETMAVRLEEIQRQREELQTRMDELSGTRADMERQLAELHADRDRLSKQNKELEDQVLRLPEELAAVTNSRAFKILKAGPFMAMRQPLSTLLIIAGVGELTDLWTFSGIGSSVYIGVAAVVLVVTAVQFWASHD